MTYDIFIITFLSVCYLFFGLLSVSITNEVILGGDSILGFLKGSTKVLIRFIVFLLGPAVLVTFFVLGIGFSLYQVIVKGYC